MYLSRSVWHLISLYEVDTLIVASCCSRGALRRQEHPRPSDRSAVVQHEQQRSPAGSAIRQTRTVELQFVSESDTGLNWILQGRSLRAPTLECRRNFSVSVFQYLSYLESGLCCRLCSDLRLSLPLGKNCFNIQSEELLSNGPVFYTDSLTRWCVVTCSLQHIYDISWPLCTSSEVWLLQ